MLDIFYLNFTKNFAKVFLFLRKWGLRGEESYIPCVNYKKGHGISAVFWAHIFASHTANLSRLLATFGWVWNATTFVSTSFAVWSVLFKNFIMSQLWSPWILVVLYLSLFQEKNLRLLVLEAWLTTCMVHEIMFL